MTDSLREIFIKSGAYAYERESTLEKILIKWNLFIIVSMPKNL